jgi:hypothetical protein
MSGGGSGGTNSGPSDPRDRAIPPPRWEGGREPSSFGF